jgi:hypothetical protein
VPGQSGRREASNESILDFLDTFSDVIDMINTLSVRMGGEAARKGAYGQLVFMFSSWFRSENYPLHIYIYIVSYFFNVDFLC